MSTTEDEEQITKPKRSKGPLLIGLILALVGGGGGFYAVQSGLLGGAGADEEHAQTDAHGDDHASDGHDDHAEDSKSAGGLAFVPLDPIVVSLPRSDRGSLLRFSAQLEVKPEYESEVAALKPRVIDVLNGYLRAVTLDDLTDPTALARLRSQMLRRVQIVAGEGRVNDVLIMEFVVN